jgi:hypothetical protein
VNPAQDHINNPRIYQLGTKAQPWGRQPEPESDKDESVGIKTPTTSSGPKSALPGLSPIQEFLPEETEEVTCQVQQLLVQNPGTSLQTLVTNLADLLPHAPAPEAILPPRHYLYTLSTDPDDKGKQPMSQTQQTIATTMAGSSSLQVQRPLALPPGAPGGGGPAPRGGSPPPGGGGGGGPPAGSAGPAGAALAAHLAVGGQNRALKGIPPKTYGGK